MRTIESDRFRCSDGERAAFEAGIKLGSLFHQFTGTPLSEENREVLEKAMVSAVMSQPHVVQAEVKINREIMSRSLSGMNYCTLDGGMIEAEVLVEVKGRRCRAFLGKDRDLDYPLMWIGSME